MRRDQLSRQEVEARLSRQMSLDEKRKYADYIVDTSGDRESTLIQTRSVYEQLRSVAP
jgi:dephospho-CoA kinase